MTLTKSASAKINLHLRVGPVSADGFHPLCSWFVTVGLADRLRFVRRPGALAMTCDDATIPVDGRNLVVKAARSLGVDDGLAIELSKRIPAGGGLGGGSSDAAATLVAVNEMSGSRRSVDELASLAAGLGSDVPFFLYGSSSVCRGRGEVVRPVGPPVRARFVVLVLPGIAMPTPAVYRKFDEMKLGSPLDPEPDWAAWAELPAVELMGRLVNDLEPPAFEVSTELATLRRSIESSVGRPVRMSGSGSTLFTLFDEQAEAETAASRISSGGTKAVAVTVGV